MQGKRGMLKSYYQDDLVTLYCGDCRKVLKELNIKVDLTLTDPPYNCGVDYSKNGKKENDNLDPKVYWKWFRAWLKYTRSISRTVIFTHRMEAMKQLSGFDWVGVWDKECPNGTRIGYSPVIPQWEPIFMYGIYHYPPRTTNARVDIFQARPVRTVQKHLVQRKKRIISRAQRWNSSLDGHPCPKPIKLFNDLVGIFGQNCKIICDPFAGSGTTGVACKQLGIKCVLIEQEERNCEIAVNRLRQEILPLKFN